MSSVIEQMKRLLKIILLSDHFILYFSILFFLILWPFFPWMASVSNILNVSSNMWPLLALAIGQMFVLIVGGIDLSQTSTMALTSVSGAMIMTTKLDPNQFSNNPLWGLIITEDGGIFSSSPFAVPMAIAVMLLIGALIGFCNGFAVAKFKMASFMVTLVSMMFFSSLAIYLTLSENIMYLPSSFNAIGKSSIGFVSYSFLVTGSLALIAFFILSKTVLGTWFYAVGKNIKTSIVSGVPTERVIIQAYVISGICAAIGSILYSARLEAGRPTLGQNLLLDIIGAVVIGGVSLFGGRGKVLHAIYGVLFFVLLANFLSMMNLSFSVVNVIKGAFILIAALLDVIRTKFLAHQSLA